MTFLNKSKLVKHLQAQEIKKSKELHVSRSDPASIMIKFPPELTQNSEKSCLKSFWELLRMQMEI